MGTTTITKVGRKKLPGHVARTDQEVPEKTNLISNQNKKRQVQTEMGRWNGELC
jgi:hypothetical protein